TAGAARAPGGRGVEAETVGAAADRSDRTLPQGGRTDPPCSTELVEDTLAEAGDLGRGPEQAGVARHAIENPGIVVVHLAGTRLSRVAGGAVLGGAGGAAVVAARAGGAGPRGARGGSRRPGSAAGGAPARPRGGGRVDGGAPPEPLGHAGVQSVERGCRGLG